MAGRRARSEETPLRLHARDPMSLNIHDSRDISLPMGMSLMTRGNLHVTRNIASSNLHNAATYQ